MRKMSGHLMLPTFINLVTLHLDHYLVLFSARPLKHLICIFQLVLLVQKWTP